MTDAVPVSEEQEDLLDNHEKYAGEEIDDPWDDDSATDWPSHGTMMDADDEYIPDPSLKEAEA